MTNQNSGSRDGLALLFTLVFPGIMAWVYFVVLAEQGRGANLALQIAFGAGKLLQFGFPIAYVWWFERQQLRWDPPSWRGLGSAVIFGLAVAAGILLLYFVWLKHSPLTARAPAKIFGKLQEFGLASPAGFLLLGTGISLLHSLLEEYYWRWFVFGVAMRYLTMPAALSLSSLGFMAHHVIVLGVYFPDQPDLVILFSLAVAMGGGVWAWIYEWSGSLYAPWLSHLLVDTAIMIVGWDMMSPWWR